MIDMDVTKIKDDIAREVCTAVLSEPTVEKYLRKYGDKSPIRLWRDEVSVKLETKRYTGKAFARILENYPHLFRHGHYSKYDDAYTLKYSDELCKRVGEKERRTLEQIERDRVEYAHIKDMREAMLQGKPYKDLKPLGEGASICVKPDKGHYKEFYYDPYWMVSSVINGEYRYVCPQCLEVSVKAVLDKYHIPYEVSACGEDVKFTNSKGIAEKNRNMPPMWND